MLPSVRQRNEPGQTDAEPEKIGTFEALGSVAKRVADKAHNGGSQSQAGDGEAQVDR